MNSLILFHQANRDRSQKILSEIKSAPALDLETIDVTFNLVHDDSFNLPIVNLSPGQKTSFNKLIESL